MLRNKLQRKRIKRNELFHHIFTIEELQCSLKLMY
jgi:hypothetical protein